MALITSIDCVLPRPDIATLHQQTTAELSKRLLGGAPVLPMSAEDVLSFVMAGTTNLMHGFVTQALKENDPATMCCDNLVVYGARRGIDLRAATRAKGYVAITGNPNAAISATIRFVGESSREYKLDPGVTFNPTALDENGGAVLRVVAALGGSAYDLAAGAPLVVSTTFPGIDLNATVVGNGITGGSDDETCEQLRTRIVDFEASGVITTNGAWYLQQAQRFPGVTRVCFDECEGCCDPAHVIMFPFFEGVYGDAVTAPYGVPPGDVLCEMTEWMFGTDQGHGEGVAPYGISGQFSAAMPTFVTVKAYCFQGCPAGADERILNALRTLVHATTCVGSRICKEQLRAAAYAAVGPDACFSTVVLEFDSTLYRQDAAYAYLACQHFLVVNDVQLIPTYT